MRTSLGPLVRVGLVKDDPEDRGRRRFEGVCGLDPCVYPEASPERLVAAGTFSQWLFFLDDQYDDAPEMGRDPGRVEALMVEAHGILREGRLPPSPSPFARFTLHLRETLTALAPEGWWGRFLRDVEEYLFEGSLTATRYWARGVTPPLERYLELRLYDSAVFVAFDIVEIARGLHLPGDVLQDPTIAAMRRLAVRHIAYLNDVVSYHKEVVRNQSPCNLVHALMHEEGLSLGQAVDRIIDVANEDLDGFVALEASLPRRGARVDSEVRSYVGGLKDWMRGNIDFSLLSPRYKAPDSPFPELRTSGAPRVELPCAG